jgi:hypothetical protein
VKNVTVDEKKKRLFTVLQKIKQGRKEDTQSYLRDKG